MSILTAYFKQRKYDYELSEAYKELMQGLEAVQQCVAQGMPQEFINKHVRELMKSYRNVEDIEQRAVNEGLSVELRVEVE